MNRYIDQVFMNTNMKQKTSNWLKVTLFVYTVINWNQLEIIFFLDMGER